MKRFFISIIEFIIFFIITMISICLFVRYHLHNTFNKEISTIQQKDVVVVGDSHSEQSINTKLTSNWANYSQGAEPLPFNCSKFIQIHKHNLSCKNLIIGINYHSFSNTYVTSGINEVQNVFSAYPFVYNELIMLPTNINKTVYFKAYFAYDCGLLQSKGIISKIKHQYFRHKNLFISQSELNTSTNDLDWKKRLIGHYGDSINQVISNCAISNLFLLKNYCLQHKIRLILYNAPIHKDYYNHIPSKFIQITDSIANQLVDHKNVFYINYSQYQLPDSCFYDCDHLNMNGANIITPILRDSLISLGVLK